MHGQLQLQGAQTAADGTCKLFFELQVHKWLSHLPCPAYTFSMALTHHTSCTSPIFQISDFDTLAALISGGLV